MKNKFDLRFTVNLDNRKLAMRFLKAWKSSHVKTMAQFVRDLIDEALAAKGF